MVWGPAQFERDAGEESCRDQLLDQQLYWQKPGVQRKYLSWRHKIGDLSAYKWHLKPWEGERDVRKEEKQLWECQHLEKQAAHKERQQEGSRQPGLPTSGNHQEESVLAAHRWSEWIGPEFQDKHNEEGGRGGGRGEERRKRSQEEHQHSRDKETWGRKEDTGREGKPVLVQCSSPLGQNLHTLDSALQAGWAEVQFPHCHGHKLEGPLEAVCCGQIRKSGIKQPYQASSCFTQDDFSWCFSAPSLSPLTELYCFTLEDYK